VDGVLVIDKPAGITSHDVVARVRRIIETRRVGHTGTLDPFATGVMVILVGKATRLAQFLDKDEKEYEAVVRFGFETDSGDKTGRQKAEEEKQKLPTVGEVAGILPLFTGETEQVPPMYSAKKVAGKKLYEHARKGETVDRRPVRINISALEVIGQGPTADSMPLRIVCSAGTYVRTLAEDIGRAVGTGAHLTDLRRTRAGRFVLSQSISLDDLADLDEPARRLLPIGEAVSHLPSIALPADRAEATKNGLSTRIETGGFSAAEAVRMLDQQGSLLAVGVFDAEEKSIHPKVVLV
jgi:tRNA pseudouridine55 synthase